LQDIDFSDGPSAGTPAILQPNGRWHCTCEICSGSFASKAAEAAEHQACCL
jgi:hypothetical protein